jgi:CRISPR-associated endoribonuclease Cas6
MITSVELVLMPLGAAPAGDAAFGQAIKGYLYAILARGDPEQAGFVHDGRGRQPKPFSCSPLQRTSPNAPDADAYSLRITCLNREAEAALVSGLRSRAPDLHLGDTAFRLTGWRGVGRKAYSDLAQGPALRRWRFRFEGPTAFTATRHDGKDARVLLPEPRLLFLNLVQKWAAFSSHAHPWLGQASADLAGFAEIVSKTVFVNEIRSLTTRTAHRAPAWDRGFIGEVGYEMLGEVAPDVAVGLSALVRYAPYAGVGARTMEGMGCVTLVSGGATERHMP